MDITTGCTYCKHKPKLDQYLSGRCEQMNIIVYDAGPFYCTQAGDNLLDKLLIVESCPKHERS